MKKQIRIAHLVVFLAALLLINYFISHSVAIPTGNSSIWFHSGLLTLIIGSYWIEHFFTKPADAVINALVCFISVSTLENPPLASWWRALSGLSAALMIMGLIIVWAGTPAVPEYDTSRLKKILYLIVVRFGSSKVLFSFVFVLSLVSYFDLRQFNVKVLVIFWAIVLTASYLELDSLIDQLINLNKNRPKNVVGILSRIADPNIIRFRLTKDAICGSGSVVALSAKGIVGEDSPLAFVCGYRRSPDSLEVEALIIDSQFTLGALDSRTVVSLVGTNEIAKTRLEKNEVNSRLDSLVGFAIKESNISRINFELVKMPKLEEGHLVYALSQDQREVMYQIVDARLLAEPSIERNERAYTMGEAEQLGTWLEETQGFETFSWVVPENAPIFHVSTKTKAKIAAKEGLVQTGTIPNSDFPVNINLQSLVLFHSAILGVTGSGKSFLAYHLIEKCAESGIKVLCLDVTGDYKRYLKGSVLLKTQSAIKDFLDGKEYQIGIFELSEEAIHPIKATHTIAQIALKWCAANRTAQEVKEPVPKLLLVMEEAHTLVPEWNSNPARDLQDVVNKTSQVTLQARKYGLGVMLITQRTANVTKSILNQCNSIFAFQAYDETGFEFMKNYMGERYVRALPNLKKRQGVLVGKASVSDRPVIVQFMNQERETTDDPIPELPAPAPAAAQVENAPISQEG
jgi:hypothetical protein